MQCWVRTGNCQIEMVTEIKFANKIISVAQCQHSCLAQSRLKKKIRIQGTIMRLVNKQMFHFSFYWYIFLGGGKAGLSFINPHIYLFGEKSLLFCLFAFFNLVIYFESSIPCVSGWPRTHYVIKNGPQFLILLPPSAGITGIICSFKSVTVMHPRQALYKLSYLPQSLGSGCETVSYPIVETGLKQTIKSKIGLELLAILFLQPHEDWDSRHESHV